MVSFYIIVGFSLLGEERVAFRNPEFDLQFHSFVPLLMVLSFES
jgi:hypothetical protein